MKRICEHCGKPITFGCMTNDTGDFCIHEDCFADWMDKEYGRGKWMELGNGEEDQFGGYYVCKADVVGGIQGTGIFYTEYSKEDLEDE